MNECEDQLRRDIAAVADTIDRDLSDDFGLIAGHMAQLRDMALELTLVADRATEGVQALGASVAAAGRAEVDALTVIADILRSLAGELHGMTQESMQNFDNLKVRLVQTVRANALGNRRRYQRFAVDVPAEARFEGRAEPARVLNLSLGGAKMDLAINTSVGTPVTLRVSGLGHELASEVVRATEEGTQLRFTISDATAEELQRFLAGLAPEAEAAAP
jgi:hypothetical protein